MKKYLYMVNDMVYMSYCLFNRLEIIVNRTLGKAYFRWYKVGFPAKPTN